MDAQIRAISFRDQWGNKDYPNPPHWGLFMEGDFYPDNWSLDSALVDISEGALQVNIHGVYQRDQDDTDHTHTPSGRAEAVLNWEEEMGGHWAIISIDTEQ